MGIAGIDLCIMTLLKMKYMRVNRQCHGRLDERQLEMLVEAAEETAVPKTAASWRKPKNNPMHKTRKCHRVKIFIFLIASYDEAARVRMQTNRILFAWLLTDAGIDEKGVGVMCLQLEETS